LRSEYGDFQADKELVVRNATEEVDVKIEKSLHALFARKKMHAPIFVRLRTEELVHQRSLIGLLKACIKHPQSHSISALTLGVALGQWIVRAKAQPTYTHEVSCMASYFTATLPKSSADFKAAHQPMLKWLEQHRGLLSLAGVDELLAKKVFECPSIDSWLCVESELVALTQSELGRNLFGFAMRQVFETKYPFQGEVNGIGVGQAHSSPPKARSAEL
jgi:hypothetical protein